MKRFHKMVMLCINYFTSIRYAYVFECLPNLVDVLIDHLYRLKRTGAPMQHTKYFAWFIVIYSLGVMLYFEQVYLFYLCVFLHMPIYYSNAVSTEARRGHHLPQNWSVTGKSEGPNGTGNKTLFSERTGSLTTAPSLYTPGFYITSISWFLTTKMQTSLSFLDLRGNFKSLNYYYMI